MGHGRHEKPVVAVTGRTPAPLRSLFIRMYKNMYNGFPLRLHMAAIPTAESGRSLPCAECATRCGDALAVRRPKRPLFPLLSALRYCVWFLLVLVYYSYPQAVTAQADTANRMSYGASVHFLRAAHTADFDSLPGIPEARERFTSGLGNGIAIGGVVRLPIQPSLALSVRGQVMMYRGAFSALQQEPVTPGGNPVESTIRHTVDASFGTVMLLPAIDFSPVEHLHLTAGPEVGLMVYNSVTQAEEIIAPAGATWVETGTPSKTLFDGALDGINRWQTALTIGAGYTFPLPGSRTFSVNPELLVSFPLAQLYPDGNWSATIYRAGVTLLFTPPPPPLPVQYDTVRTRDTLVRIVAGLEREQIVQDTSVIRVEQSRSDTALLLRTFIGETYVEALTLGRCDGFVRPRRWA
jgi:hypothetical protein